MEKLSELFARSIWPLLRASTQDAKILIQSNSSFFERMKERNGICPRAWVFGIIVAFGLGVLGLPASRSAGITPSLEFLSVMTLMNWLLVALYGMCFGLSARLLASNKKMLISVNAFFYVAIWLVVLKLFEMPALGARLKAMTQSCVADGYDLAVTSAISQSQMARDSQALVLIGYILFIILIIKMQRQLHGFGWTRALLSTAIGMALLCATVSYVQGPIISQLMCSYKSSP